MKLTVQNMETQAKNISKATGRKTGNTFFVVWNTFMDIIYLLAIATVVSVAVYVAYQNGVDHPAIVWAGEKVSNAWLIICQYFKLV